MKRRTRRSRRAATRVTVLIVLSTLVSAVSGLATAGAAAAPATVDSVTPTVGSGYENTRVRLQGSGFAGTDQVLFGETPAKKFKVVSDTRIDAETPTSDFARRVGILVHGPGGWSVLSAGSVFTYSLPLDPPFPEPGAGDHAWATRQGNNARTGHRTNQTLLTPANYQDLTKRWTFDVDVVGAPAVVDGTVYVETGDGRLVAIDARTGALRWSTALAEPELLFGMPVVDGHLVYVAGERLSAIDAKTGKLRWQVPLSGQGYDILVADHIVYVATDGGLFSFDERGAPSWSVPLPHAVYALAAASGVILTGGRHQMTAFNRATGAERWTIEAGETHRLGAPSIAGSQVFFGDGSTGTLTAVDLMTGKTQWSRSGLAADIADSPTVTARDVFVGLVRFDRLSGAPRNDADTGQPVVVANGLVVQRCNVYRVAHLNPPATPAPCEADVGFAVVDGAIFGSVLRSGITAAALPLNDVTK